MLQTYLVLAASAGLAGLVYRRHRLTREALHIQRNFEREQRRQTAAARSENELRARLTLEEQSRKIQDSLTAVAMFLRKAETHFAKEEWRETEKLLLQSLALDEHNPKANRLLALAYLHQGEWKKAELICQKLIKIEPKEPSHYGNLGLALYYQDSFTAAQSAYKQALTLDATKASRWVSLGQVCMKLTDFAGATDAFFRAVKLDRKNIDYLLALGESYTAAGEREKAVKAYEQVLDISPYNDDAKHRLAELVAPATK